MDNTTKLNEMIYAGVKLVSAKIDVLLRNSNISIKPELKLS